MFALSLPSPPVPAAPYAGANPREPMASSYAAAIPLPSYEESQNGFPHRPAAGDAKQPPADLVSEVRTKYSPYTNNVSNAVSGPPTATIEEGRCGHPRRTHPSRSPGVAHSYSLQHRSRLGPRGDDLSHERHVQAQRASRGASPRQYG